MPPEPTSPAQFDPETYWSTRLEKTFSLDGVGWQGLGEGFNRWCYRVRRRVFRRAVRSQLPGLPSAGVLDVGSGTGFYVTLWHELGAARVTGSDLTDVAVERLTERNPGDRFLRLDITTDVDPGAIGAFDAVSAMDVLFHIVDDAQYAQAIHNLAALLRPGGLLFMTENMLHGEWLRGEHQVSRGLDWIGDRLAGAGLEVIARRPMFVLMNTPVDSPPRALALWWRYLNSALHRWPARSAAIGASVYPLELALTSLARVSPSTELVVCRRRTAGL